MGPDHAKIVVGGSAARRPGTRLCGRLSFFKALLTSTSFQQLIFNNLSKN